MSDKTISETDAYTIGEFAGIASAAAIRRLRRELQEEAIADGHNGIDGDEFSAALLAVIPGVARAAGDYCASQLH